MDKDKEIENLWERIEELKQQNEDLRDYLRQMKSEHKSELNWIERDYENKLKKELGERKPYWSLSKVLIVIIVLFFWYFFNFVINQ